MDFAGVLDSVSRFLDSRGSRYALVGAFVLSAYGLSRATQDLDLLERFDELRKILDATGS